MELIWSQESYTTTQTGKSVRCVVHFQLGCSSPPFFAREGTTMTKEDPEVGDIVVDVDGYEYHVCDVDGDYVGYVDEYGELKYTHKDRVK